MTPWAGRNRGRVKVVVEPTMRAIMQMHVDEEGRLWVLNSRGAHPEEPGIHSVWDVFDAEGRFDQEVALACEGRGRTEDEDSAEAVPFEVICYRMTP